MCRRVTSASQRLQNLLDDEARAREEDLIKASVARESAGTRLEQHLQTVRYEGLARDLDDRKAVGDGQEILSTLQKEIAAREGKDAQLDMRLAEEQKLRGIGKRNVHEGLMVGGPESSPE